MSIPGGFTKPEFKKRSDKKQASACCGTPPMSLKEPEALGPVNRPWADGTVATKKGEVPRVRTSLLFSDRLGSWRARWGFRRMKYTVEPGLYAAGNPTSDSPVLVTANYKMSFDRLRSELKGLDAWIMVLDTKGINVWCAAGKGTFGTDEIVRKIESAGLRDVVSHRRLILPQLGATGASAHAVGERAGFHVVYGPVRASDLPAFLASGMKATPEMRSVRFTLNDRAVLIPMEIVLWAKYALIISASFLLLSGLGVEGYSLAKAKNPGFLSAMLFLSAYLGGSVLGPILLPWLPGRAFSMKGLWLGLGLAIAALYFLAATQGISGGWLKAASWALIIPAVTSFVVMNFTGSSTYTSLSGVKKEMQTAVPLQIAGAVAGVGMWLGGLFV
jgi:acetyl-CoA decarbonylase/synthase complex subunit gamma